MFEPLVRTGNREADDRAFIEAARALVSPSRTTVEYFGTLSNLISLLNWYLEDVNWVGVYLLQGGFLQLATFQGLPACDRIPLGKGVCGTCAERNQALAVPDVHVFEGHIACDSASNSELVCPIVNRNDMLIGVLDVDSPRTGRFCEADIPFFMEVAGIVGSLGIEA